MIANIYAKHQKNLML